jgi:hypothetical protein
MKETDDRELYVRPMRNIIIYIVHRLKARYYRARMPKGVTIPNRRTTGRRPILSI